MALGRTLKRALYETLPTSTLHRAAEHAALRGRETLTREELIERFVKRRGDSDILGFSWQLRASELRSIAKALRMDVRGLRRTDELRTALFELIDYHSATEKRRRARRRELRPVSMTGTALIGIGVDLARPVQHLFPNGRGRAVAVWHDEPAYPDDDEPELWLSLDLTAHPFVESTKVLELFVSPGEGEAYVRERAGALPRSAPGRTRLYAHEARELPTLDVIFLRGPESVGTWLRENEWDPTWGFNGNFPDAETAREYSRVLRAEHPLVTDGAWAQLGGWPMTWPDESAQGRIDDSLVLRTYRHSERG